MYVCLISMSSLITLNPSAISIYIPHVFNHNSPVGDSQSCCKKLANNAHITLVIFAVIFAKVIFCRYISDFIEMNITKLQHMYWKALFIKINHNCINILKKRISN